MARVGINPARGKLSTYLPAKVTIALLTCIPYLDGYYQHRLPVLELVLESLQAHTNVPYDLLVFDNGSCAQVRDYLSAQYTKGAIDFLILSQANIGKIGAFKMIFNAAPGDIVAYTDDDILFYPGWLEAHLKVLSVFPRAGMVSGVPVREGAGYACQSLEKLARQGYPGLVVRRERRVPDEWEADWAQSTGRDPEAHLEATRQAQDLVLRFQGLEAIGTANHFQFVSPKKVVLEALPEDWSGKLMGSMVELDETIDANGYLRLSTARRYTRHLGNTLSPAIQKEIEALNLLVPGDRKPLKAGRRHWLMQVPGSRRLLKAIYNRMFDLLSGVE
jgi:glycosyltransferase involved in cell wall biosynthesis